MNMDLKKIIHLPLTVKILSGLVLGIGLGHGLGSDAKVLGEIGKLIIEAIKGMAAPLVFFAIIEAILTTTIDRRAGLRMLLISVSNALMALFIGLSLSTFFRPGDASVLSKIPITTGSSSQFKLPEVNWVKSLMGHIPLNPFNPFLESSILPVIILALLCGFSLRKILNDYPFESSVRLHLPEYIKILQNMFSKIIYFWVQLIPLAVMSVVAKVVGENGLSPIMGLFSYLSVALLGLVLQVFLVYQFWLKMVARMSLLKFWHFAKEAVVYAMGASSSLATLPVTLNVLEKMGVSKVSARMSACVGTNFNNDGILLYEMMAAIFVAQVYGIELSSGQIFSAALICIIAGIGIAGIPEAGLISLALVLKSLGLPDEILPLLLTVDWVLGRARAMTNVCSDMMGAILLDVWDGKKPLALR